MQAPFISFNAFSTKGTKSINQDAYICECLNKDEGPSKQVSESKNCESKRPIHLFAIADGVSSSTVSQWASDYATSQFLKLFKLAPEQWSIAETATTIIQEINALLYTKNQNSAFCYTPEKGYVCTFSLLILTSHTMHVFHIGDGEIKQAIDDDVSTLTNIHREVSSESSAHSYLSNALGISAQVEIEVAEYPIAADCTFAICTDGVYEHIDMCEALTHIRNSKSLAENEAEKVVQQAIDNGSNDNLTLILITISGITGIKNDTIQLSQKPHAIVEVPELSVGETIDGLTIKRQLYTSARSHVFLASSDRKTYEQKTKSTSIVLKIPATEFVQTEALVKQFSIEAFLTRRIHSPHVIKSEYLQDHCVIHSPSREYSLYQYIEGQTLSQWVLDNPRPTLEQVRNIVEQVAMGLQALHRQGIIHQDVRPDNIMINREGHCTIIDLGAAALINAPSLYCENPIPGTALYSAPEYFLGEVGTPQSDQFSLAVLAYFLLCGRYPYGTKVAHCQTVSAQNKLKYQSTINTTRSIPLWVDNTLRRALHINPTKRFSSLSEFTFALRYPNPSQYNSHVPLIQRHPLVVYKALVLLLVFTNLVTLVLYN